MNKILLSEFNDRHYRNGGKRYKLIFEDMPDFEELIHKYYPDFEILEISSGTIHKIVYSTDPLRRINVFINWMV